MSDKSKMRYGWVDDSKGIVILLMVLGHTNLPEFADRWIWAFHMPFFFFISGLFTGYSYPLSEFVCHKAKQLLKPFIVYSVIVVLLWAFALNCSTWSLFVDVLIHGWGGIALWFVPVLFFSLILVRLIPDRYLWLGVICFLLLASLLSMNNIVLPWTLSSVAYASAIVAIGRALRRWVKRFVEYCSIGYLRALGISVLGLGGAFLISMFYRLDMAFNCVNPILPITIGAMSGIVGIISLAIVLNKYILKSFGFFSWCGKNTYEIMALSQVIILDINSLVDLHPVIKYIVMGVTIYLAVIIRKWISRKPLPKDPI